MSPLRSAVRRFGRRSAVFSRALAFGAVLAVVVAGTGFASLVAGDRSRPAFGLITICFAGLVFVAWLLERCPAPTEEPVLPGAGGAPDRHDEVRTKGTTHGVALGKTAAYRVCSLCGTWQQPGYRLIPGDYGAVCEMCALLIANVLEAARSSRHNAGGTVFDAVDWWPNDEAAGVEELPSTVTAAPARPAAFRNAVR